MLARISSFTVITVSTQPLAEGSDGSQTRDHAGYRSDSHRSEDRRTRPLAFRAKARFSLDMPSTSIQPALIETHIVMTELWLASIEVNVRSCKTVTPPILVPHAVAAGWSGGLDVLPTLVVDLQQAKRCSGVAPSRPPWGRQAVQCRLMGELAGG